VRIPAKYECLPQSEEGMEIEGECAGGPAGVVPEEIPLAILYEDDYLMAIDKGWAGCSSSFGHKSGPW